MLPIYLLLLFTGSNLAYECHDVGNQKVIYDPTCSSGQSVGCNAGGQGLNCRFCWAVPDKCTTSSSTPQPGTATTTESQCHYIGKDKVVYDPACSQGETLGCNAGGQGPNCRFCWAVPDKCKTTTSTAKSSTTIESSTTAATTNRCSKDPLSQTECSKHELSKCGCSENQYCCLEGPAHGGCSNAKWTQGSCTCACKVVPYPVPDCTFEQYLFAPCNVKTAPYYCPSTNGCGPARYRCSDLCFLTPTAPYPERPSNTGTYEPGSIKHQTEYCGRQEELPEPKCTTQPDDHKWKYWQERTNKCMRNGWWCDYPATFNPSKYQCGPALNKTVCPIDKIQAQECRISPPYHPPSWAPKLRTENGYCDTSTDCDNKTVASHCVGCCLWNNPELKCYDFWQQGKGDKCRKTSPRWNWIITTCDTMGAAEFSDACQQNPFSAVDVRYVAVYQLTRKTDGTFVWKIAPESSINWQGNAKFVDFGSLPTEHTGKGVIQSCSGGGGGWNAAFFPYKMDGATPPAFMFVLSYSRFENAAWFMLNQRILDGGPSTSTCKDMTNCWGEISAGEIDFLETPNLFSPESRTQQGWNIFRTTSYNAANRCFACSHAFHDGSLNIAGCGGQPANSFYDANTEESDGKEHLWAAVVDARGTTVYKDPVWPGMAASCTSNELINLHPEKPSSSQPCNDPKGTCAMYLPGCVTKMTPEMTQITNGDYSRIPYCYYVDWAVHTTCTENWWDLMVDTGQWVVKEPQSVL